MTENWIMSAGIAVWTGIGIYLCFLTVQQRRIAQKLNQLEKLHDDGE